MTRIELSCEERAELGGSGMSAETHPRVIRDQILEPRRRREWWEVAGCLMDCELPMSIS